MTTSFKVLFSGSTDGVMSGTSTVNSDWVKLSSDISRISISLLWTGDPTGTFSLQGKIGNKRTSDLDSEFADGDNPDGTVYTGSLTAADLDAEDLGEALLRANNLGVDAVRLKYINSAGSGIMNAALNFKTNDGEFSSEADMTDIKTAVETMAEVVGTEDDVAPTKGNQIGGVARSSQQTAVDLNDFIRFVTNLSGELVVAGFDWALNAIQTKEIDPLDEHYAEEELIDAVDIAAATNYYPSSDGRSMGNINNVSIQGVISGGVTFTFEVKTDDSTDWIDITQAGYRLNDNSLGNVSIVDESFIIDFDDLHVRHIRIKSVTSDSTNAVQYHWKLTSI